MKPNVGGIDKVLRIIGGAVILAVGYYYQSWWGLIGLVVLFTGLINWCPVYLPFKFSTRKTGQS